MTGFGKFVTGALISAALAVGGVWFVVDLALRGVEKSIDVTNARIGDSNTRIEDSNSRIDESKRDFGKHLALVTSRLDKIDEKIGNIQEKMVTRDELASLIKIMNEQLKATRQLFEKTDLEGAIDESPQKFTDEFH